MRYVALMLIVIACFGALQALIRQWANIDNVFDHAMLVISVSGYCCACIFIAVSRIKEISDVRCR